jgi:type I restriction enzyme M protein
VSLTLIAENDYNLNIPRYVDTFEAEEAIDINTIAKEIRDIDQNMLAIDKVLADYCKQLNIETPF